MPSGATVFVREASPRKFDFFVESQWGILTALRTGQQVFGRSHIQKGEDSMRGLQNWLNKNTNAPYSERLIARSLLDDLLNALGRAL